VPRRTERSSSDRVRFECGSRARGAGSCDGVGPRGVHGAASRSAPMTVAGRSTMCRPAKRLPGDPDDPSGLRHGLDHRAGAARAVARVLPMIPRPPSVGGPTWPGSPSRIALAPGTSSGRPSCLVCGPGGRGSRVTEPSHPRPARHGERSLGVHAPRYARGPIRRRPRPPARSRSIVHAISP
jgi:hypothetical protein